MSSEMSMEFTSHELPEEALQAWVELLQLNLTLHQPKVEAWLHSEEADPILKELLINVPCPAVIN